MGEKRRITVALVPALAIHVALALALGALLVMEIDTEHRILPVSLLAEPAQEPLEPSPPRASRSEPERTEKPGRKPKRMVALGTPTPEAEVPLETGPAPAEEEPAPAAAAPAPAPAPATVPAPPPEPEKPDVDALLAQIRAKLQKNLVYPPVARLNRIQGRVDVRFEIQPTGAPKNVKVVASSGFEVLDEAAVKTVLASAPLPVVPLKVKVPVVFKLD